MCFVSHQVYANGQDLDACEISFNYEPSSSLKIGNLAGITIEINKLDEQVLYENNYSYFKVSNDEYLNKFTTDKNGDIELLLEPGEYSLYVNEDSLPGNIYIESYYMTFYSYENVDIKLYSIQESKELVSTNSFGVNEVGRTLSVESMSFNELLLEFENERKTESENFKVFSYLQGTEAISKNDALNIIEELELIKNYFCGLNGFIAPKTRTKQGAEISDPVYVFVASLSGKDGLTKVVTSGLPYKYILINYTCVNSYSTLSNTLAHEYFHAIQSTEGYAQNKVVNLSTFFTEGTATMAGFLYATSKNYSQNERDTLGNEINEFANYFFNNSNEGIYSTNTNYNYGQFLFHLYVYENYGGYNIFKDYLYEAYNLPSNIVVTDEIMLQLYMDVLNDYNSNILNNDITFEQLYEEFLLDIIDPSESFNLNGYGDYIHNSPSEDEQRRNMDYYNFLDNNGIPQNNYQNFSKGSYKTYRIDASEYSYINYHFILHFKLSRDDLLYTADDYYSNLKFKIYYQNGSDNWIEFTNANNHRYQQTNRFMFSIGNYSPNAYKIIIYNLSDEDLEFNVVEVFNCEVVGECLYGIYMYTDHGMFMYYNVDEYGCISDNTDIFVSPFITVSYVNLDVVHQFWFNKVNNQYEIIPNAEPFSDSTCTDFMISGDSNTNDISIKCSSYSNLIRDWNLVQVSMGNNIVKGYKITAYNDSSKYVVVNQTGIGLNATCNVTLGSTSSENCIWRLYPIYCS